MAIKHLSHAESLSSVPRARDSLRRLVCSASLVFFLLSPYSLLAEQTKASEYAIKATYLYNFSRFVQWPADAAAPKGSAFPICVLGEDPFGDVLETILSGESVDGRAVVAKRVSKVQDTLACRVLYISVSEDNRLQEILAALDKAAVLTVSDIPQFSQRGGMIQFVLAGSKIRFEVNLTNTQTARLTLSSDLLKVAVAVRKSPQPGD